MLLTPGQAKSASTLGVRRPAGALPRITLLIGPTVIAFFAGGFHDDVRAWAGAVAWALVVIAVVINRGLPPRGRPTLLALGGLAALAAWTLLSMTWAFVPGHAYHAGQITMLYLGALIAATLLLRGTGWVRAAEPLLLAGVVIVLVYGISERLLPGLLHFTNDDPLFGRLSEPMGYWNAAGVLAAIGFVLSSRLAGDASRPAALRVLGAAAGAPLALGLFLTSSRGALFACVSGLVCLLVLARSREQVRSVALTVAGGIVCWVVASGFKGVTSLDGSLYTRESQGAIMLAVLVAVMLLTGLAQALLARREKPTPLRLFRWAPAAATALICLGLVLATVVGSRGASGGSRYTNLSSERYAYWNVAFRAFSDEPLRGIGAGQWYLYWYRYRKTDSDSQYAHSLEIETLAELGVVGFAALLTFLGGMGLAARDAYRRAPAIAAGPIAAAVVWVVHSPLDWDWQMPALTLVAVMLGGVLLGLAVDGQNTVRSVPA